MATFPFRILPAALALLLAACATSREPANLTHLKSEVATYIDNGTYDSDLRAVSARATSWIEKRSAKGGKLAIVFDIDETVLSNLPHIRKEDWGYDPDIWGGWVRERKAPALDPVREVYRTALAKNVAVFFITGRKDYEKASTAANLRSQGMGTYAGLIVKPSSFPAGKSAVDFKAPERALIEKQGYTVIASIGDQQSDLDGGHAEKTFKLPNPFYFIP